MLTVHHLNNSRSQRILWLLEELEIPYELKKYQRTPDGLAPPELIAISPLGKSPLITDGDVTLAESGAIIDYIIATYGNGRAVAQQSGYIHNLYFSHYAEGSLMPVLILKFIFTIVPKKSPFLIRPFLSFIFRQLDKQLAEPQITQHLKMIEEHLAKSKSTWFAGGEEPTAADYQMAFPLEAVASEIPNFVVNSPHIKKYVETVHSRPAYKRAIEKGGKYSYAKL
ncbi:Glutathione S-transferase 3 [Psilocybe cubensis]|uniref:Glutathione S-transferase 3 n=2 Tax=Psilocybe cubensis TaxID=181762 RepID=A0ACB8GR28_PSICU|nr:Glutathione S-transferase 3 [Psilocybe cubensis]KAH9477877.1 Glutathione S-transferase 3 [Psilocybe cubensis]